MREPKEQHTVYGAIFSMYLSNIVAFCCLVFYLSHWSIKLFLPLWMHSCYKPNIWCLFFFFWCIFSTYLHLDLEKNRLWCNCATTSVLRGQQIESLPLYRLNTQLWGKSFHHSLGAFKESHLQPFNHDCRSLQLDRVPGWHPMELSDESTNIVEAFFSSFNLESCVSPLSVSDADLICIKPEAETSSCSF